MPLHMAFPLPSLATSSIFRGPVLQERLKTSNHRVVGADLRDVGRTNLTNLRTLSHVGSAPHISLTSSEVLA